MTEFHCLGCNKSTATDFCQDCYCCDNCDGLGGRCTKLRKTERHWETCNNKMDKFLLYKFMNKSGEQTKKASKRTTPSLSPDTANTPNTTDKKYLPVPTPTQDEFLKDDIIHLMIL